MEAVTVARELTLRAFRGELPGIPSAHVVRFTGDGEILIEGPVAAGRSVGRAARLLEAMLPGFDAPPELRVPGALRLVLARALGTLDLPAYKTLDAFAEALARFAAPDASAAIRELVSVWSVAVQGGETAPVAAAAPSLESLDEAAAAGPGELTISDVRRARRATGLPLTAVAERSRIPVSLLRELEWGYFVNWPAGTYGRTQLVRYARAAGLDEQVIVRAILPEIQSSARAFPVEEPLIDGELVTDAEPAALVRSDAAVPVLAARPAPRRGRIAVALAIPALLVIGLIPAFWASRNDAASLEPVATEARATANRPQAEVPPTAERTPEPVQQPTAEPVQPAPAPAPPAQPAPLPGPAPTTAQAPAPEAGGAAAPAVAEPAATEPLPQARPAALRADAAFSPAFATVGSAMFYHAEEAGGSAIMRADTDRSGAVLRITSIVNDSARNFHARPSPDGQHIAFDSDRQGERAVFVADANGRNVRRVTGDGFAAVPSWSPDGRKLAYVRAEANNPRVWNLWTVDLDSGDSKRLTSHKYGQPWGGAWFPDGKRIAYSHENRLIVRSVESGTTRTYTSPKKNGWIRTPAVSPDGSRIMFQIHKDGAWLLDLRDGSMRKVLSDPTAEEFTWSPDGRRVAYHSRKTGRWGVWIMAAR